MIFLLILVLTPDLKKKLPMVETDPLENMIERNPNDMQVPHASIQNSQKLEV